MKVTMLAGLSCQTGLTNTHIYKQAIATFASCLLFLTGGLTFGYTAVLLPQLQDDNAFPYDKDFDSWIASIAPLAMMFGCLCSGPMSDFLGRRLGQMLLIFPFTLGWFVMGIAKNNVTMLIGRFITGLCTGAIRPVGMVYIGEISDPKFRAVTLFCPSFAIYVGSIISHTIGFYLSWRVACFAFGIPNLICFVILLFLKESPLWMITKGKIDEGVEAFRWFRGNNELTQKELNCVLEKHEEKESPSQKEFIKIVFSRGFLKSLMTIFFIFVAVQLCGINTITFYAQDIFKNTFGEDLDAFMLMIVTDCIRVIISGSMCLLAKNLPRKITFLVSCFVTTLVLVALVIYLQIKPAGLVWIAVTCLVAYIAIASILTSIAWSFTAELFPSQVRGLGSGLSSLISFSLLFISVKVTPGIMINFGEPVMYGSFATMTFVAALFLCFILVLPETNGKSLQDIENSLYNKKDKVNVEQITQTHL